MAISKIVNSELELNFYGKFAGFSQETQWKFFLENWHRYCQEHFKNGPHQRTMQTHPCPAYKVGNQGRDIFMSAVAPQKIIFFAKFHFYDPLNWGSSL